MEIVIFLFSLLFFPGVIRSSLITPTQTFITIQALNFSTVNLTSAFYELNSTEAEFNSTNTELNSTETEFNSTETEFNSTETEFNSTKTKLFNSTVLSPDSASGLPPPTPAQGFWNVTDGNKTCILAYLKLRFKVALSNDKHRYVTLPPHADSTRSSCRVNNKTQTLVLHVDKEFDLAFTFVKRTKSTYMLRNITLALFSPNGTSHFYNDMELFSIHKDYSYWCSSKKSVSMENVTMESFEMHIQAFADDVKKFSLAKRCSEDNEMDTIITVIVGCVLAVLFTVMIICFELQRRKLARTEDSIRLMTTNLAKNTELNK